MSREYKVYGTDSYFINGKQVRAVVAAKTKKRVAELLGFSPSTMKDYCCVTGNKIEVAVAMGKPETVFYTINRWGIHENDYVERVK